MKSTEMEECGPWELSMEPANLYPKKKIELPKLNYGAIILTLLLLLFIIIEILLI